MSLVDDALEKGVEKLQELVEQVLTPPKEKGPVILDTSKVKTKFVFHLDTNEENED